jgi:hypothetical protein
MSDDRQDSERALSRVESSLAAALGADAAVALLADVRRALEWPDAVSREALEKAFDALEDVMDAVFLTDAAKG